MMFTRVLIVISEGIFSGLRAYIVRILRKNSFSEILEFQAKLGFLAYY
jgi:hypothetical protein